MALQAPFYPIIYVRGYAMTQGEIDDTSADPFCGFNLGSTVYRATVDYDRARKFVFESPMVRLASDFGYVDAFESGYDIVDPDWPSDRYLDARSVVIFRYYEQASKLLGNGKVPSIPEFASQLGLPGYDDRVQSLPVDNPERFRAALEKATSG